MVSEPAAHNAETVAATAARLLAFLEAENARCKISLWQHDETGHGFFKGEHAAPIDLAYFAERMAEVAHLDGEDHG